MNVTERYRAARGRLMALDPTAVAEKFTWPEFEHFNFGLDWFDAIAQDPARADQPALIVTGDTGTQTLTFAELSARSTQVAGWCQSLGVARRDKYMMLLGNEIELWGTMWAGVQTGAVNLSSRAMVDSTAPGSRVERGGMQWALTNQQTIDKFSALADFGVAPASVGLFVTGHDPVDGAYAYTDAYASTHELTVDGPTPADAEMLVYFTSGTTSE